MRTACEGDVYAADKDPGPDPRRTRSVSAELLDEPGDRERYELTKSPVVIGAEVERGKRYTGCLRERGYTAAQRPI